MTGRDLILYILENNLEDEQLVSNGKLLGFLTVEEMAARSNVGVATVNVWLLQHKLTGVLIGDKIYIPAWSNSPVESVGCMKGV